MNELDLETVRAKAKELGVTYHPAQKAETIQGNIDQHLQFLADEAAAVAQAAEAPPATPVPQKPESELEALERLRKEAFTLIPVTVTSMDPVDASVPSALISVGNRRLGQVSKAIPFGFKWYMPKILLDHMKEQQFIRSTMVPVPGVPGAERLQSTSLAKYAITYHPLPTQAELDELAKAQALGNELAK